MQSKEQRPAGSTLLDATTNDWWRSFMAEAMLAFLNALICCAKCSLWLRKMSSRVPKRERSAASTSSMFKISRMRTPLGHSL